MLLKELPDALGLQLAEPTSEQEAAAPLPFPLAHASVQRLLEEGRRIREKGQGKTKDQLPAEPVTPTRPPQNGVATPVEPAPLTPGTAQLTSEVNAVSAPATILVATSLAARDDPWNLFTGVHQDLFGPNLFTNVGSS